MADDLYFVRTIQILRFTDTTFAGNIASEAKEFVLTRQGQGVVASASNFNDTVFLKLSDSLWLLNSFEITMTELPSVLLNRCAAPGVQVAVLINCCEMMFSAINLNGLDACQSGNQLRLVVMGTCHLKDCLIFKQANGLKVVARNHPDTMHTQGVLNLESKNAFRICIFTNFAMEFAA